MTRSRFRVVAAVMVAAFAGCERRELSGPPGLRMGRDACAECGMLISEDRCACALLTGRAGTREYAVFDDIGCMLDFERSKEPGLNVIEGFVHDHVTRQWVSRSEAVFLFGNQEKIPTPMGSGIVAFTERVDAEKAQREFGGSAIDFAGVVEARRAWMEERYGKPNGGP